MTDRNGIASAITTMRVLTWFRVPSEIHSFRLLGGARFDTGCRSAIGCERRDLNQHGRLLGTADTPLGGLD